jgi:hypothetical protein
MPVIRTGTGVYCVQQIGRGLQGTRRDEGGWRGNEVPVTGRAIPSKPIAPRYAIVQTPEAGEAGPEAQTVELSPAVVRILAAATTVQLGGVVANLSPAQIRLLAPAPTVLVGGVMVALSAAVIRRLAPARTVTQPPPAGDQSAELLPAVLRLLAPAVAIATGGITANLSPAAIRFLAPALALEVGGITANIQPAVIRFLAGATDVVLEGEEEEVPSEPWRPPGRRGDPWRDSWWYDTTRERFEEIFERPLVIEEEEEKPEGPAEEEPVPTPAAGGVGRGTPPAPPVARPSYGVIKSGVGISRATPRRTAPGVALRRGEAIPASTLGLPPIAYAPSVAALPEREGEVGAPSEEALLPWQDDEEVLVALACQEYYA